MNRKKAFTLIELLVVISIIALLLAILIPALRTVKERASSTICRSNLRHWGTTVILYNNDFNDSYMTTPYWMTALRSYYGDNEELRCCKKATKVEFNMDASYGPGYGKNHFKAWGYFVNEDYGSYGFNGWLLNTTREQEQSELDELREITPERRPKYWRRANARRASNIPIMCDSQWYLTFPTPEDAPPPDDNTNWRLNEDEGFYRACVNRHYGNVSMVFMDGSARLVGLKELWTLKWHRGYNTRGMYTKAGGATEDQWPGWMERFKDF